MKKLFLLFFLFSSTFLLSQTFCLRFDEGSLTATEYTVKLEMQGSSNFLLGSSNLQFSFNDAALSNPTFVSTCLSPLYGINVSEPNPGEASMNIEQYVPGLGTSIDASPSWSCIGEIKFTITDPLQTTTFNWSYNGGTTGTVVFNDALPIFATSTDPPCMEGLNVPLPLDLLSLNAKPNKNDITLNWTSANELNFNTYELERSTDGALFETIASIDGKGNAKNDYDYLDNNVLPNRDYYYRLKMNDLDLQYTYSKIVSAKIIKAAGDLRIYPNPVANNGILNIENSYDEKIRLKLYRPNGKLLKDLFLQRGETTEINLNGIATGVLNYSLETSTRIKSGSIVVQ